ncbi:type II secretion system F family protein [Natronomonas amylolytica]|uniref:type II secretion system F family protein n=1 Tax=Natronomonas amylolytica TaxID=3108498 RepID=UPI00300B1060
MSDEPQSPDPTASMPADFETDPETEERIPVPEYEAEQYLPESEHISGIREDLLREEFGYVRTYFKSREEKHTELQRHLNQAHLGKTFDIYLTRTLWYSLASALVGGLVGLLVSWLFARTGVFTGLTAPWGPSVDGLFGDVVLFVSANKAAIGTGVLSVSLAGLFGATTWFTRYYYPSYIVDVRRRNINVTLPHTIVYMYALSFGGMDFVTVLRRTAETEGTYGEVAHEFETVVKDVDMFGSDLFTALRNARNRTPSDSMEQFLDDMLTMLDSGGDVTEFLREEANKHRDRAVREQDQFLQTLELLSEVFIVGFVAAPLFFVVTLLMMSFLGQQTLSMLFLIVYAILPLAMIGFVVLISTLSEPFKQPAHELQADRGQHNTWPGQSVHSHPEFQAFRRIRVRERLRSLLTDPVAVFRRQPLYTLFFTVPVAAAVGAYLTTSMAVTPAAFLERAYEVGVGVAVVPFFIITVPLALFHELNERRKRHVAKRLPDTLDILASANQMGLSLSEGLDLVSRNLSGTLAEELLKVRNDIEWNADVRQALLSLAGRLQVPQLTRTCKILAEGTRSTGDLHKVLSITAEDTRQRYRLERNRNQELQAYTTVVILGFLVYLAVIVILDYSFLGTIVEQVGDTDQLAQAGLITISGDSVGIYRALFFHSALIQAVGTGVISGKLTANSVFSGLKYSIGLVGLTVLVFGFL